MMLSMLSLLQQTIASWLSFGVVLARCECGALVRIVPRRALDAGPEVEEVALVAKRVLREHDVLHHVARVDTRT